MHSERPDRKPEASRGTRAAIAGTKQLAEHVTHDAPRFRLVVVHHLGYLPTCAPDGAPTRRLYAGWSAGGGVVSAGGGLGGCAASSMPSAASASAALPEPATALRSSTARSTAACTLGGICPTSSCVMRASNAFTAGPN